MDVLVLGDFYTTDRGPASAATCRRSVPSRPRHATLTPRLRCSAHVTPELGRRAPRGAASVDTNRRRIQKSRNPTATSKAAAAWFELTLPRNSRVKTGKTWNKPQARQGWKEFRIYRWNPDDGQNPRMDTYWVERKPRAGPWCWTP